VAAPILAFAEQRAGSIKKTAFEALTAARNLAKELGVAHHAVLVGKGVAGLASQLQRFGAASILVVEADDLEHYSPEGYVAAVEAARQKVGAETVLMPASAMGRDLAGRLGARIDAAVAQECVEAHVDGGVIVAKRPIFAGKALLSVKATQPPFVMTLRPNLFRADPGDEAACPVETMACPSPEGGIRAVTKEVQAASADGKVDLTEAEVIVSGGRGMKGPENYGILEELAGVLGGTVGASRASVDAGWRPHADQVGQTGKTVTPNLYVACGISGAIQHLAGMSTSKVIVAINKDAEAPIFKVATYGIVGDLFEVVPKLTEELRALKAQG